MYNLIIWDKGLAAIGQDGSLSKLEIPIDLAKFFFHLDSAKFPSLSRLSFDDYDLFSDAQIESLVHELLGVVSINPSFSEPINSMVKVIYEAQSLGKSILFDPFRKE
jgi:phenylalanine-4-hydroxylase